MWTIDTIARALNKATPSHLKANKPIHKIHNDSRLLDEDDCFIALESGHNYLKNTNAALTIG